MYDLSIADEVSIFLYKKKILKQNLRWAYSDKVGPGSGSFVFLLGPHGWIGIVYVGNCVSRRLLHISTMPQVGSIHNM